MYRTVLILAACLFLADGAGAVVPQAGAAAAPVQAAAGLSLAQPSEAGETEGTDENANPADASAAASEEHSGVVQEIVAGVLTGSLAAVLMLKLLYGRRRKDDSVLNDRHRRPRIRRLS